MRGDEGQSTAADEPLDDAHLAGHGFEFGPGVIPFSDVDLLARRLYPYLRQPPRPRAFGEHERLPHGGLGGLGATQRLQVVRPVGQQRDTQVGRFGKVADDLQRAVGVGHAVLVVGEHVQHLQGVPDGDPVAELFAFDDRLQRLRPAVVAPADQRQRPCAGHPQAGPPQCGYPVEGERLVDRGQALRVPATEEQDRRQDPGHLAGPRGVAGDRAGVPGDPLGLLQPAYPEQRLGLAAQDRPVPWIAVVAAPLGLGEQFDGEVGGTVRQGVGVLGEPVDRPAVDGVRRGDEVRGHLLGGQAGVGERLRHLAVQGRPGAGRRRLVQRVADQVVPELQPVAGLGQYPGRDGLVEYRQQRTGRPAGHRGQIEDREVGAEYGGDAQQRSRVRGQEAQPVPDRGRQLRQRFLHRLDELGDAGVDLDPFGPQQRVHQFACVQRVSAGVGDRVAQPRSGFGTGGAADDLGHLAGRQRTERENERAPRHDSPAQARHGRPYRYRAAAAHEQQRQLLHGRAEPVPDEQARLVSPLKVVEREDHRRGGAQPVDSSQEALYRGGYRVGALHDAVDGLLVQQRDDLAGRFGTDRVDQRAQRQPLTELVADGAVRPAAVPGRVRQSCADQRGFADARFALDPHDSAAAAAHRGHRPTEHGELVVAAYRRGPDRRGGHIGHSRSTS